MAKIRPNERRNRVCPNCNSIDTRREKNESGLWRTHCNRCGRNSGRDFPRLCDQYDSPWKRGKSLGHGGLQKLPAHTERDE